MEDHSSAHEPPTPDHDWDPQLEQWALQASPTADTAGTPQAPSIAVASVWQMPSPAEADAALADKNGPFVYRRDGHPNDRSLAQHLSRLHGAAAAALTAQGMSALAAIALTTLQPGDQVWVADELYGKSIQLFTVDLVRWQVTTRTFDPTNLEQLAELRAARPRLVLVETLSNPRLRLPDLSLLGRECQASGSLLVVDNTFATHLLCQPLALGADLVVESLSKQVNGHSDAMLGLVAARDVALLEQIKSTISTFGMASSPLDCFLTERGLSSLALRLRQACSNAAHLASALHSAPGVRSVDHPSLLAHPQHSLARKQLRGGFGWMLSFHLASGDVQGLLDRLAPEIAFVPSLGDICTTLSHPASTSHRGYAEAERVRLGIHQGTIRVSCGVEPKDWLVERFLSAISAL